tara:strand:+ start:6473 stop:6862 length:390 start_codon:yes stop_codon:yes gene_type:complete
MSDKFTVEIISPEKSILKTETNIVVIPSYEGEMSILKDHIPLITFLRPGIIKIDDNFEEKYFVEEGVVEFKNNNLLILTSTAKNIVGLNKNFIDAVIKDSSEKINNNNVTDKEKYLLSYKINTLKEINQ